MRKIEELKKIVNFYVLANKLKTTVIDEDNNYSISDHIFGSITIAIAMNSEFRETDEISKIIRMMILDEFTRLYPDYNLKSNLKNVEKFEREIDELRKFKTKEAKLVFKYRMLDFSLTNLIATQGDKLDYSELLKEAVKIIMPKNSEEYSKCEEIFKFYYLNSRLKKKVRSGWDNKHWNINSDRIERVSEHIISTIVLAMVIESELGYNEELDFDRNIEIDKIIQMLAIHELGETLIGDITPFDGITPEQKQEMEHKAMVDAVGKLADGKVLLEMLFDFDAKFTNEARFAYYCDKIDADLQSKYYQDSGLHHTLDDQKNNCVFASKKVHQMIENGAQTAFDIWYLWDKDIYIKYSAFSEFSDMLKLVRDNDIFGLNNFNPTIEKVELDRNEYDFITEELGKVIATLYQDENIDCIYQINYQTDNYEKGAIKLVILLKDGINYYEYERLTNRLSESFKRINQTKINVWFDYGYVDDYEMVALNPSEVHREERLLSSTILFDKSGRTTDNKERINNRGYFYPHNLVEYVPPIEQLLILKLKK